VTGGGPAAPRDLVTSGFPFEKTLGVSRVVRTGAFLAVSGTAPIGPDGRVAHVGNVYRQTRLCLSILQQAIEDAGGALEDVVRTRVMLVDLLQWREAARAHGEVFAGLQPASTLVGVTGFIDAQWLVEVEADAILASGPR
jgi:enamine deaminase RidA (YjgF/YER057c/UK114 family)